MLVMTQVVRDSSISIIVSARITSRGTRFYNQDSALVIKRWLNRVEDDASGLTFQEWTPDVDTSRPPVTMMINSSDLCAAGFKPALETVAPWWLAHKS
jgi:hypothetical protein